MDVDPTSFLILFCHVLIPKCGRWELLLWVILDSCSRHRGASTSNSLTSFLDEFETQKENQSSLPHVILGGGE